ncbi:MAG: UPF0280 family protein [Deltaproteobacteria bacterium]|nr:UPF0280 family protein [Deltaproteobacteria bacterium]MBW2117530.1 UPF0280 family protein [Deltaproteobacteria bacterium]
MSRHEERSYRNKVSTSDMTSFHVAVKETDLWVSADRNLEKETTNLVFECRKQLEMYIKIHPEFATSLSPYGQDPYAPAMIREMIDVTRGLGVGPMASVAGAIAQYVGGRLMRLTDQVIVENGGDIFLKAGRTVTVSIFAGDSPLSERFGLLIPERQMPIGVCSSSARVGHSLSMGIADVVCILSSSAALADGAATALGNRIMAKTDIKKVAGWASRIEGIMGGVTIVEDSMATWGDVELVEL